MPAVAPPVRKGRVLRGIGAPVYYGWILVTALGLTTTISYGTTQYLFGVLVVPLSAGLGWNRATVSGAYACGVLISGLLGVPIGHMVDRRGARWLMSAGSLLGGASLIGLASIHEPWQLYLLWGGGLGLATALTFYPVSFTVVTQWFQRKRGTALAVLTFLGGFASPIFIPLSGGLVAQLGWRETVVLCGITQLALALPLHVLVVRRRPEDLGLRPDGDRYESEVVAALPVRPRGMPLGEALRQVAFWTLTWAVALGFLAQAVVFTHQIAFIIGRGYDAVLAATLAGSIGLASLPGRFVLNVLSDRLGSRWLLAGCFAFQAIGIVALVHGTSLAWLVLYVVLYGAGFGAVSPLRASVLAEQFGRRAYGAIIAAQGLPVAMCAAAGPLVAGWLYDTLGSYRVGFWLTATALALAALAVAATPKPRA